MIKIEMLFIGCMPDVSALCGGVLKESRSYERVNQEIVKRNWRI